MSNYGIVIIVLFLVILLGLGMASVLKHTTKNPQPNIISEEPAQCKLIGTVGDHKIYEIEYEGERYVAVLRHRAVAIIKHEPNRSDDQ